MWTDTVSGAANVCFRCNLPRCSHNHHCIHRIKGIPSPLHHSFATLLLVVPCPTFCEAACRGSGASLSLPFIQSLQRLHLAAENVLFQFASRGNGDAIPSTTTIDIPANTIVVTRSAQLRPSSSFTPFHTPLSPPHTHSVPSARVSAIRSLSAENHMIDVAEGGRSFDRASTLWSCELTHIQSVMQGTARSTRRFYTVIESSQVTSILPFFFRIATQVIPAYFGPGVASAAVLTTALGTLRADGQDNVGGGGPLSYLHRRGRRHLRAAGEAVWGGVPSVQSVRQGGCCDGGGRSEPSGPAVHRQAPEPHPLSEDASLKPCGAT